MNRFAPTRPHQPSEKALRSVFVGNIGYDVTEEELAGVFSRVGPVVSFRLVYDRETGKSKGFGFCEFHDQATANNAIRMMNQFELRGRNLRLDSAVANERMMMAEDFRPPPKPIQPGPQAGQTSTAPGESPYGLDPSSGKTPEAIAKTLSNLSPEMMFKVIQDMKRLAQTNPKKCRHLLDTNPQLSFALLQAQVMMHWLNTDTAFNLLDKNMSQEKMAERAEMSLISAREEERSGPAPHASQPFRPPIPQPEHQFFNTGPQAPFRPQFNPQQGPPPAFRPPIQQQPAQRNPWQQNPPQQRFNVPPTNFAGNPFIGMQPQQQQEFGDSFRNYGNMPSNPVPNFPGQRFPLPPQQSAFRNSMTNRPPSPQAFQGSAQSQDQDEVEMINQLLSLTDEQIEALNPEEQAKVRELRKQFGMGR